MQTWWQDIRFGLRMLAKNPAFTAIAVITLALGIGANTAIFSILRQVLLQRLPVQRADQLVLLYSPGDRQGHVSSDENSKPGEQGSESFSYPMYLNLRDHNDVFSGLAAIDTTRANVAFRGQTETAQGNLVSGNYFDTLGVSAALGRTFEAADTAAAGGNPVIMLSYAYWKSRFGGDASVLNQSVLVDSRPMTIVGVVQAGFDGVQPGFVPQVYIPITMVTVLSPRPVTLDNHKDYWIKLIGRLKPGMTRERAMLGIAPLYSALLRDELSLQTGWGESKKNEFLARKLVLRDGAKGRPLLAQGAGPQLLALMSLVGIVLFIACANVAGLLTARGAARQREIAIQIALGAGRSRLIRKLVIESVLLSSIGAVAGLALANWTSSTLVRFASENSIASGLSSTLSLPVLAFTAGLALVCGVLFGVLPSFRATRVELVSTLKEQGGALSAARSHTRLRQGLVICQVALTLLLVTGAGGFARSLFNVQHIDLGLRASHLMQFSVAPRLNGYDQARSSALFRELEDRIGALPGVQSLSGAQEPLLANSDRGSNVTVEGEPPALAGTRHVLRNAVGPGHFSNLGIPLLRGREFTRADGAGSPKVAIVNETFAKTFFSGGDPLGRRMKFGAGSSPMNIEIIGVVKNSHHSDVREDPVPFVYAPYMQEENVGALTYYVHSTDDQAALASAVHKIVGELDSSLPVNNVRSFEQQISSQLASDWLVAVLAEIFGVLAALLAAIGIYGLLAYTVTQRTREIGVRIALGADVRSVSQLVLKDVAWLVVVGVLIGLPLAFGMGRLVDSMLYGVKTFAFLTVGGALVAIAIVALAAAFLPVRRATRVDPLVALRYE